jgi:hypothetical protein
MSNIGGIFMNNVIPLTKARKNLSELVNQAYYEDRLFGIAKGKKSMGAFVGAKLWKDIIRVIEEHDPSLADTLAIMADPELQKLLEEGDESIRRGEGIPWEQVVTEVEEANKK